MTWKEAFLKQAESDYLIFKEFVAARKPVCHQLHYLQMATEKLAKSLSRSRTRDLPPRTTHAALTKFLRISKNRQELQRALGYEKNHSAYLSYIDSLLPFAEKIESLVPVGKNLDQPNPEYPWRNRNGNVVAPLDYKFDAIYLDAPNLNKFKTLIENLFRIGKSLTINI